MRTGVKAEREQLQRTASVFAFSTLFLKVW